MASSATAAPARPGDGRRRRRRRAPGWVPNQHGAWAMLATPLVVGVLASGPRWVHLPLAAFWFAGYFAFFATGCWLKSQRKARYLPPVRTYAALAAALGLLTLALDPALLRWAPLFVAPLVAGLVASARRTDRALFSGLATTAGSALMTLPAYDAGGGGDWERAGLVAAVLFAYFGGTVVYVKTMIRERDSRPHYRLSVTWHALSSVAMGFVSLPLAVVFAVLTARAAAFPRRPDPMTARTVGLIEIVAMLAVAIAALVA